MQQIFAYPEEMLNRGFVIAVYYAEMDKHTDALEAARSLAVGQSVGTWTPVPGITPQMLDRHMARVVAVYDLPPVELPSDLPEGKRPVIVHIAFPEVNFGAQFPMLLTTLLGNEASTSTQAKLIDLQFSQSFAAGFQGPRFGIEGVRKRLGVWNRPILLNMIKPCTGFGPDEGAALFAEVARGGVDIIKDDELLGNPSFNALVRRVEAYRRAAERIFEETGHRVAYCANITDRVDKLVENARRAQELGAAMVMVNAIAVGLGALHMLAEDDALNVPILAHSAGAATLTENPRSGIASPLLLGKLVRIAGADAGMFNSIYTRYPTLRERYLRIAHMQRMPLFHLKPSLPTIGGGITPGNAVRIIQDLGPDIMLAVGGAIHGHPDGAAAGARAMRQAIDAAMEGVALADKAAEHPELRRALEVWGP